MLQPLQAHILYLENTIQSLKNRLTRQGLTVEEIEDIELQLSLSESALDHYRHAYALELKIAGSEPPSPGSDSGSGAGGKQTLNDSTPRKKNDDLAGLAPPISRKATRPTGKYSLRTALSLQEENSSLRSRCRQSGRGSF